MKNEFIVNHIDNLLHCVGFVLSDDESSYYPQESNIFIDAGICNILSKLDEFHVKFKKYLFKINNKNIDFVKTFEMDLKTKIIDNDPIKQSPKQSKIRTSLSTTNVTKNKPFFPSSPSY